MENEDGKYKDLKEFSNIYRKGVKKFLESNPESRIVFLNSDYGVGKTTFIKEVLGIDSKYIYSPWLYSSENYIRELNNSIDKNKAKNRTSDYLKVMFSYILLSLFLGSLILILINISNNSNYNYAFDRNISLFLIILVIVLLLYLWGEKKIKENPFLLQMFYRKEYEKDYQDKLIEEIVDKIEEVIVIEDIDRVNDIEKVLIVATKLSNAMKNQDKDKKKYILLTGDYIRTKKRIENPGDYDNNKNSYGRLNKGDYILDKTIGLRIDFPSKRKRIKSILFEKENEALGEKNKVYDLTDIEMDEFVQIIHIYTLFYVAFFIF